MRNRSDSPNKNCTLEGCIRPLRARGLCATHYNQKHQPNRHPKIAIACTSCGQAMMKDKSATRWVNHFCSELCRQFHSLGRGWFERLPSDHIARHVDATCKWPKPAPHRARGIEYEVSCGWCEATFSTNQPNAVCCSGTCKRRRRGAERRAREAGAIGTYTWGDITRLWRQFGRACAYCAKATALTDIQAEHVIALSRGGANNLTNLLPSCGACNSDKRDLSLEQWAHDRMRRGLPPVKTTWGEHDRRYLHLVIGHQLAAA